MLLAAIRLLKFYRKEGTTIGLGTLSLLSISRQHSRWGIRDAIWSDGGQGDEEIWKNGLHFIVPPSAYRFLGAPGEALNKNSSKITMFKKPNWLNSCCLRIFSMNPSSMRARGVPDRSIIFSSVVFFSFLDVWFWVRGFLKSHKKIQKH